MVVVLNPFYIDDLGLLKTVENSPSKRLFLKVSLKLSQKIISSGAVGFDASSI